MSYAGEKYEYVNSRKEGLSIIIPVYNEEIAIRPTLVELQETLSSSEIPFYEILVVDDGSSDHTVQEIHSHISCQIITHKHNKGYGLPSKQACGRLHTIQSLLRMRTEPTPNQKIPEMYTYYQQHQFKICSLGPELVSMSAIH